VSASGRSKIYAVLTGDLVKSSRLSPAQSKGAIGWLRSATKNFEKSFHGTVEGTLDSFRHDSWQLLLKKPALALRAAIFLRAALKTQSERETKYDSRIAIGIGPVESIAKDRISNSRGKAFTLSGQTLDGMKAERLAFADVDEDDCLARGVVPLLDQLVSDWSAVESQAVYGALRGWTQEESAANWPVGRGEKPPARQAVAKALSRAHWNRLLSVLEWRENAMQPPEVAS
jgi:hypothetical protein